MAGRFVTTICAAVIAEYLENIRPSIVNKLDLTSNQIDDDAVLRLARALTSSNAKLAVLNLTHNQLTTASASQLARAMSLSPHLTDLNLSNNHLGDPGVRLFFDTLCSTNTQLYLRNLNLNVVNATDNCMSGIARFLSKNPPLQCLTVNGNDFTERGMEVLVQALEGNKHSSNTHLNTWNCLPHGMTRMGTLEPQRVGYGNVLPRFWITTGTSRHGRRRLLLGTRIVLHARPALAPLSYLPFSDSPTSTSAISATTHNLATLNTDVQRLILLALDTVAVLTTTQSLNVMQYAEPL
ncbi:hypothetical protein BC938DRAFT_476670 [Jimgerdemannia flammicorona]|uniref:Uncharacterized protein n=1 Tax=Jimgerdemannia flammicorona TaxID=994334 RepID=A0A433PF93_9FUNG|nr:hypothetical protein BC938DRAFT_476670 [Jimgerdemannia flammicorona]